MLEESRPTVGFFGTWRCAAGSDLYESARALAREVARAGCTVISGGYSGIMEAASRGAREAGGHVIGVTTPSLDAELSPNRYVTEIVSCESLQRRAATCIELADYSIFYPGRAGTATELMLALECVEKNLKPAPVMLADEFWLPVVRALESVSASLPLSRDVPRQGYAVVRNAADVLAVLRGSSRRTEVAV